MYVGGVVISGGTAQMSSESLSYIALPAVVLTDNRKAMTVEIWLSLSSQFTGPGTIFSARNTSDGLSSLECSLTAARSMCVEMTVSNSTTTACSVTKFLSNSSLVDLHVLVTYSTIERVMALYVNGALESIAAMTTATSPSLSSPSLLYVGSSGNQSTPGLISNVTELRIWVGYVSGAFAAESYLRGPDFLKTRKSAFGIP